MRRRTAHERVAIAVRGRELRPRLEAAGVVRSDGRRVSRARTRASKELGSSVEGGERLRPTEGGGGACRQDCGTRATRPASGWQVVGAAVCGDALERSEATRRSDARGTTVLCTELDGSLAVLRTPLRKTVKSKEDFRFWETDMDLLAIPVFPNSRRAKRA